MLYARLLRTCLLCAARHTRWCYLAVAPLSCGQPRPPQHICNTHSASLCMACVFFISNGSLRGERAKTSSLLKPERLVHRAHTTHRYSTSRCQVAYKRDPSRSANTPCVSASVSPPKRDLLDKSLLYRQCAKNYIIVVVIFQPSNRVCLRQ